MLTRKRRWLPERRRRIWLKVLERWIFLNRNRQLIIEKMPKTQKNIWAHPARFPTRPRSTDESAIFGQSMFIRLKLSLPLFPRIFPVPIVSRTPLSIVWSVSLPSSMSLLLSVLLRLHVKTMITRGWQLRRAKPAFVNTLHKYKQCVAQYFSVLWYTNLLKHQKTTIV